MENSVLVICKNKLQIERLNIKKYFSEKNGKQNTPNNKKRQKV